ncbi:hypothetical protein B0I35DRAFT_441282 [Stachybotrys elegans]|uniref:Uncharacterized protein n=1 Tax=Stachybotrys elegans TaxID=80388 RepID=A0A8K0WN92_9HYPO|nr:hypothetical protein B0I35DRAFT_441282 [Stachybotrys elegans]
MKHPTLLVLALSATSLAHDAGKATPSSCLSTSVLPVMTLYTYLEDAKPTKLPSPQHPDTPDVATAPKGDFYNDGKHEAFAPVSGSSHLAAPKPGVPEVSGSGAAKRPETIDTPAAPNQLATSGASSIAVGAWAIGFMGFFAQNMLLRT